VKCLHKKFWLGLEWREEEEWLDPKKIEKGKGKENEPH
jgi:hypothetical protein